jgi:hypothetical protein
MTIISWHAEMNDHSPLTRPKEWSTFIGSNLGEELSLHRFSYIWCETLEIII